MTKNQKVKLLQLAINAAGYQPELKEDGKWGPLSQAGFDWVIHGIDSDEKVHSVLASSFADHADISAFKKCKAKGKTDSYCFNFGDNGEGYWGDDTKEGSGPSVALTPEDMKETWGSIDNARGRSVMVKANGSGVLCKVKDTMMHRSQITNGAGIDLNPDAAKALKLNPPFLVRATWEAV